MGHYIVTRYRRTLNCWLALVHVRGRDDAVFEASAPTKAAALKLAQDWVGRQQQQQSPR